MRIIATMLLALLFAGCSESEPTTPIPLQDAIVVAGAIRPTSGGEWELIDDEAHEPRGVEKVTSEDGAVVIHFTEKGSQVVTFVATPDETLATAGVAPGASVGLDRAVLTLAPEPDYAALGDLANVWFYGVLEP
ncbi:hypothetical protein [Nocardioides pakistanensis]